MKKVRNNRVETPLYHCKNWVGTNCSIKYVVCNNGFSTKQGIVRKGVSCKVAVL